ncbi:hypothetical protein ASPZODRAFT_16007 [Penicilliopsis zonata CBS 506.65]|uniref:Uncharacterized protein n=1 Tax=Penicilliopsis zonata CBS 506.65 TaxID=1073090 RepID=A0A1L9SJI8_9EURO|nr:hypothetical protein ASPZODRAFT_16007 [Penicilliopsis zonata CBS 506.65]OJJ47327.1 hypothetical protein ASPZODRAFT_16007 [Penicilliopsis zonata CBS 506.65]
MGLFHHSSKNHTCPVPAHLTEDINTVADASKLLFGTTSFYRFNMILSGACTAFACLTILALLCLHATHLSKPKEQIKIMRISLIIPIYSILSFLSICFPNAYVYLDAWLNFFEGIALVNFFLLLCDYLSTDPEQRNAFFAQVDLPADKKTKKPVNGLDLYRKSWIMAIQFPIVSLIAALVTAITQAASIYCLGSNKPYFAHLWISIVQNVSVGAAVINVLRFFTVLKAHLKGINPLVKFVAFKIIVGFTFLISIIFLILRDTSALAPSDTLTWADVNIGLPTMIICILMVPISVFFHYAYGIKPYKLHKNPRQVEQGDYANMQPARYEGGLFNIRMWLSLFSIRSLIRAMSLKPPSQMEYAGGSLSEQPQLTYDTAYRGRDEVPYA